MSKIMFKRSICALFAAVMAMIIFTLGASANTRMRPTQKREAQASDNMSGMTTNTPSAADSGMPDDNTVGSAPGTGEFGDDTSDTSFDATDTTADTTKDTDTTRHDETGNLESAIDGVMDDTGNTVDDMEDGMGIWGVVIVIAIIAAIAILVFAFFSKRK